MIYVYVLCLAAIVRNPAPAAVKAQTPERAKCGVAGDFGDEPWVSAPSIQLPLNRPDGPKPYRVRVNLSGSLEDHLVHDIYVFSCIYVSIELFLYSCIYHVVV